VRNVGIEPTTYRVIEFAVCIPKLVSPRGFEPRPPGPKQFGASLAPNQERFQVTLWRVNFYKKEIVLRPLLLAYVILPFIAAAHKNLCPFRRTNSFNLKLFSTLSPLHQDR
jgi:hypothetical protein